MAHREKLLVALAGVFALSLAAAPEANAMHIMEGYLPGGFCIAWGVLCLPFVLAGFFSIRRTVQDAVNSGDFRRLNQTVSETLGRAADEIDQAVGRAAGYWQQRKRPMPEPLYRKTKGVSLKGGFFTAAGVLIGFGGFLLAVFWGIRTGLAPLTVASLVLMCGGWLLFGLSRKLMKRIRHFREYNKIIGEREYCNVEELAEGTGLPEKKVKKDLLWMLGKGWYLQGQMSKDGACLITSRRMYEQYRRLEEERRMREEEAAEDRNRENAARAQEEEKRQSLSPEV